MFDNINTYYKDANTFINELTADEILKELKLRVSKENSAELYAYISKAYIFLRDNDSAIEAAKKSIAADSKYAYGYIRLSYAYARNGDKEKARKYAKIACDLTDRNNNYLVAFLIVLMEFCEETQILEKLKDIFTNNIENSAEYYFCQGFIYSQDYPIDAADAYLKAKKLGFKDTYTVNFNLADNYYMADDYENAEKYIDECLKCTMTAQACKIKAECLKERNLYESAIKYLRKKYKLDKNEEDKITTLTLLIYNSSQSFNKKRAEKYIKFAFKNFEPTSSLCYVTASYYENEEDYVTAIDYYKLMAKVAESETVKSTTYTSISYCYSMLSDNEKALNYADKAIKIDGENSYAYYRRGRIYTNLKDYETAIYNFSKSLDYDKTDVDSFQWISYCYSMIKKYEKSIEYANRAILINKDDCYSYFRKAWAYQELGKYQEALKFYEECIRCNDRYIDAYLNISYVYSKLNDIKQSLLYANKALLINKDYAYAHYRKAWALQESGRFEEAYDGYSKAMELDPTDIYNYLGIACISLNKQENKNALLYANKALFIDRNCGGAYYYKSLALSNLGKTKDAEIAYTKAVELGYLPK